MTHRGPCQPLLFRDSVILYPCPAVHVLLPRHRWAQGEHGSGRSGQRLTLCLTIRKIPACHGSPDVLREPKANKPIFFVHNQKIEHILLTADGKSERWAAQRVATACLCKTGTFPVRSLLTGAACWVGGEQLDPRTRRAGSVGRRGLEAACQLAFLSASRREHEELFLGRSARASSYPGYFWVPPFHPGVLRSQAGLRGSVVVPALEAELSVTSQQALNPLLFKDGRFRRGGDRNT